MIGAPVRITYDAAGTTGVWAGGVAAADRGLGGAHGAHRPLQTRLLSAAGRGILASTLWPHPALVDLDLTVRRWRLAEIGDAEARRLASEDPEATAWLDAYLE